MTEAPPVISEADFTCVWDNLGVELGRLLHLRKVVSTITGLEEVADLLEVAAGTLDAASVKARRLYEAQSRPALYMRDAE